MWLYAGETGRLGGRAAELLRVADRAISPMVLLELAYLRETGRIRFTPEDALGALGRDLGLRVCDRPFGEVVAAALGSDWSRDPFDRLIAAQAHVAGALLATKDAAPRDRCAHAVW